MNPLNLKKVDALLNIGMLSIGSLSLLYFILPLYQLSALEVANLDGLKPLSFPLTFGNPSCSSVFNANVLHNSTKTGIESLNELFASLGIQLTTDFTKDQLQKTVTLNQQLPSKTYEEILKNIAEYLATLCSNPNIRVDITNIHLNSTLSKDKAAAYHNYTRGLEIFPSLIENEVKTWNSFEALIHELIHSSQARFSPYEIEKFSKVMLVYVTLTPTQLDELLATGDKVFEIKIRNIIDNIINLYRGEGYKWFAEKIPKGRMATEIIAYRGSDISKRDNFINYAVFLTKPGGAMTKDEFNVFLIQTVNFFNLDLPPEKAIPPLRDDVINRLFTRYQERNRIFQKLVNRVRSL